jgi:hypothetical protein
MIDAFVLSPTVPDPIPFPTVSVVTTRESIAGKPEKLAPFAIRKMRDRATYTAAEQLRLDAFATFAEGGLSDLRALALEVMQTMGEHNEGD